MESKAKLFGHPIHPMLIVFPLGLLGAAVIFDIVHLVTGEALFATVAFWNIVGGLIGGLLAAVFGLIDWIAIPSDTRAKSVGLAHAAGNVVVIVLFGLSLYLRWGVPNYIPGTLALVLSFLGAAISLVSGWLGGELVDRLAVGVDPGANLNAPNSLTGAPAAPGADRAPGGVLIPQTGRPEDGEHVDRD
jgi:uncharacterized membrane protein